MPGCNDGDVVAQHLPMINQFIESKNLKLGKLLHSRLLKTSLSLHTLLSNRLLHMYAKCGAAASARAAFTDIPSKNHHSWNTLLAAHCCSGDLPSAHHLFDQMPHGNLVSYNTMISTLTRHGHHRQALHLFLTMRKRSSSSNNNDPVAIDKFTVVGVGTACAALSDLTSLRQLHAVVVATGLELNLIMSNVFVDAYGKCGDAIRSRLVFDRMETRDVVSWTSLLGAYARAGRMEDARWVFDRMPLRNAVSWTALISGHEQNGLEEVALELFERMVEEGVASTAYTLLSVLSACARLGLIARGKQVHGYSFRRSGVDVNVFIYNALIDMYAKCGDMNSAATLFDRMSERDVVTWNSMITGFAQNGCGNISLSVFEEMIEAGVRPTDITLLGVLSACSHTGLVSEGRNFLDLMEKDYGVRPGPEHHAAFVDALGRNCRLEEAVWFIKSLHSSSGLGSAWGALLGSCQMHGNLELAKRPAEVLFELEPENSARYVTLSNIYAATGQWDEARKLRVLMKGKGLKKELGFSWIEMKSAKHLFAAEDNSHSHTVKIYQMLNRLVDQMGATPDLLNKQHVYHIECEELVSIVQSA